jgi:hypothetical protein
MSIATGNIQIGILYTVFVANITYNSTSVTPGNTFLGVFGINNFAGSGLVYEVLELKGSAIEYLQNSEDLAFLNSITAIAGMSIEFALNESEKVVNDTTQILGMSIELIDYPFYSFSITETRL